jgi:molecular chaperone DnaK (HSP70)
MEQSGDQEEMPQETGLSLGIDFGNSKISAAVWDPKKKAPSNVIFDGKYQFPATLYCTSIPKRKEGEGDGSDNISNLDIKAKIGVNFDDQEIDNYEHFVYDIKKLIGQRISNEKIEKFEEIKSNMKFKIELDTNNNIVCFDEKIPFENLAKLFFEKVKNCAESQFGDEVISCTISVPHGFNHNQRNAIEIAAKLAGIKKCFIINDPLSTAIYYASKYKVQKTENIVIIDFGSSKLDVTLLTVNKRNSIKVKISGGNANLGGDIFNYDLQNDIEETYKSGGGNLPNEKDLKKLILIEQAAETVKKDLTFKLETSISIPKLDGKNDLIYSLKRENFDDINNGHYSKIIQLINSIIKESNQEIHHIILQGDALRIVALTNLIKKEYPDTDIIEDLYDSIAFGSAIYAAQKVGMMNNSQFKNFKTYDITPLSLGIRGEGDLMSVILSRGSRVPIKVMKYYITTQDNQNNIKFEIYAGERKLIKDNLQLHKIMIKNLPQMNKGQVRIEVTFEVDENFRLTVTAKELSSNQCKSCKVVINEELSSNEIMEMIHEAKIHEQEDLEEKQRIEAMLRLNDKIFEYNHLYEGNEDILRELESYRNWIKHSTTVPKEEYEKKLKELNETMLKDKNDSKNRKQTGVKRTNKLEEEKNPEK